MPDRVGACRPGRIGPPHSFRPFKPPRRLTAAEWRILAERAAVEFAAMGVSRGAWYIDTDRVKPALQVMEDIRQACQADDGE